MKTTYHNIPALPFAADADVEALRRQLEGGSLEANEDGTVSTKDSKVTKPTIAQSNVMFFFRCQESDGFRRNTPG